MGFGATNGALRILPYTRQGGIETGASEPVNEADLLPNDVPDRTRVATAHLDCYLADSREVSAGVEIMWVRNSNDRSKGRDVGR